MSSTGSSTGVDITFTRSRMEKIVTVITALLMLQMTFLALRSTVWSTPYELSCERSTDRCELHGSSVFGKSYTNHYTLSELRRSEVRPFESELQWFLVDAAGHASAMGNPTGGSARKARYQALAVEMQQFLDTPSRASFRATYDGVGGPSATLWIVMGSGMLLFLLVMLQGWTTTLRVEPGGKTLATRLSISFIPGASRTIPLTDIQRAEVKSGWVFLLFSVMPTQSLRLVDRQGKVLFSRRTGTTPAAKQQFAEYAESINQLLTPA